MDRDKVVQGLECCNQTQEDLCGQCPYFNDFNGCMLKLRQDALALLKEQEAKPLRCKECSYHRNDDWCNEHGREVNESDYCSFGAWECR